MKRSPGTWNVRHEKGVQLRRGRVEVILVRNEMLRQVAGYNLNRNSFRSLVNLSFTLLAVSVTS